MCAFIGSICLYFFNFTRFLKIAENTKHMMEKMRNILSLITMCALALTAEAQINKYGNPFITNYPPEVYDAEDQNWAAVQDQRGFIYVANYQAVLEYDGSSWRSISIPNASYIYSLAIGDDGVVYVGGVAEFGYLKPDSIGSLTYKSLSKQLPDSIIFSSVLQTYSHNGVVYFCSSEYVFEYSNNEIKSYKQPDISTFSFIINDSVYISSLLGGLNSITDGSVYIGSDKVPGGVRTIVEMEKGVYCIQGDGVAYIFDTKKNKLRKSTSDFFSETLGLGLYSTSKTQKGELVNSFLFSNDFSFVVIDSLMKPVTVMNKTTGLNDNVGINSFSSDDGMLWCCTNNGISKVELGSLLCVSDEKNGISGLVQDVVEFNGKIYVATYNTVYYKTISGSGIVHFEPIEDLNVNVYSLCIFKDPNTKKEILLCGTQNGLFEIKGTKASRIKVHNMSFNEYSYNVVYQSQFDPNKIYVGYDGIDCFVYDRQGWRVDSDPRFKQITGDVKYICDDVNGDLWIATDIEGIMMFPYGKDTVYSYDEEDGINTEQVNIKYLHGHLFFCTADGIMEFCDSTQRFVRSSYFGEFTSDTTKGVYRICEYGDGFAMSCRRDKQNWIEIAQPDDKGGFKVFDLPFRRLPNKWADAVYVDSEGTIWIGASTNLFSYHSEKPFSCEMPANCTKPFNVHIRSITANDNDVIFNGAFSTSSGELSLIQNPNDDVVLPYSQHNLDITYSATFYEESERTEYSTMLKGSEKTWSKWTTRTEVTHTNLSEGNYTFMVKARNIYGVESNIAEYNFRIKPPFYRTILAYILYLILLSIGVYGIVKWNTRRLIAEKKKLEMMVAEATEEIRAQNEQLEMQKDEIEKQKDEIQSSINYARRIQRALLTPDATIDRIFPDHFLLYKPRNVVSGDYYWFGQFGDYKVSIVADCTGHGVPGGFMSMLGMTNLNYIVGPELSPDMILNKLREAIITSLRQRGDEDNPDGEKKDRSQDGMDVAMYVLNETTMTLSFAGANNPLVLIRDGEAQVFKASKMPVGIYAKLDPFDRVDMEVKKGDCLYTFSDGFQDQFGFESGRKFMSKHLRELLVEIHQKPMAEQKEILNKTYEAWRGPADHQTDDVVLFGLRI